MSYDKIKSEISQLRREYLENQNRCVEKGKTIEAVEWALAAKVAKNCINIVRKFQRTKVDITE